jgi:hypothetical protein
MYTEQQLEKLISEVETEFTSHLAKAEENFKLAKSEDGEKKPEPKKEEKKPEEKKPEGEKAPAPEAKAPAEGEHKPEAAAPAAQAAPAPQADAAAPPAQAAGCDYDSEDLAHMEKMYMSMSEPELKAHHDCIAKLAKCGGGANMKMSEAEPKAALQNSPDNNVQPAIQKSEDALKRENGGKIEAAPLKATPGAKSAASDAHGDKINVGLHKSEGNMEKTELELVKSELEAQKAKGEGLQKNLDAVTAFLTKLVEKKVAPQGKAITSMEVIAKSENTVEEKVLTKGEIDAALGKKSMDPKLEKSERDLINAYYLSGASINSISHLLK